MPPQNPTPESAPRRLRPVAAAGLTGFVVITLLGLTSGLGGAAMFAGLYVAATGVWALLRRRSWIGRTSRRAAAAVLAGGLVLTGVGAAIADPAPDTEKPVAVATPVPTPRSTSAATAPRPVEPSQTPTAEVTGPAVQAPPEVALATALLLTVKGRAPRTGYSRDLFGAGWVDTNRNGCDTRNDILARDLTGVTFKAGTRDCVVLSGVLADPYSGGVINFVRGNATSNDVQIDHVVALSDAWQKGAQGWDETTRVAFANDPLNLLAVDGTLNQQKSDGDTATWLPPNRAYRCAYVARQVAVKYAYGLWVTAAEQDAMVRVLSTCPDQPLPDGTTTPAPPTTDAMPAPSESTTHAPVPEAPAPADPGPVYYANCDAARAAGAAPLHTGDRGYRAGLDRDNDGNACE